MRVMWIHEGDESERWRALLQRIRGLSVVEYHPARMAAWWPGFSAAGFEVLLVDERPLGATGIAASEWWSTLSLGAAIPPVILLAREAACPASTARWQAILGPEASFLDLSDALEAAATRQREALAVFRASVEGREVYQFGSVRMRDFRRLAVLANGREGSVYLAESERDARLVVVKVLPSDADQPSETIERFLQEYAIVRRLSDPRVVEILDLGIADQGLYLVMEFFPYGDLRRRMRKGIDVHAAWHFFRQMAEALAAIHQLGILHRDLKPANVMLREDGSVVLIDFGLAKQLSLESEITGNGHIFGTPHYMSPEQGHGRACDVRSDLYSLGIIFHEMLTGQKPFVAESPMGVIYQHSHQPVPTLPASLARFQGLIDRLLAKAPADRFDSAEALLAALGEPAGIVV